MKINVKEIYTDVFVLDGDTFVRNHEDGLWHVESTEIDTMTNGEHDTYESPIAVCDDLDCDADLDINPDDLFDEPDREDMYDN